MLSRLFQRSVCTPSVLTSTLKFGSAAVANPIRSFSKTYDPNAVKDAPRPTRDDFRYSEPYRFRITEEMLDGYPEEYKRVFGLDTMSQDDINRAKKQEIIGKFQRKAFDTGSSEVQIALLTERIRRLTEHLWYHHKDFSAKRQMYNLVGRRKKLMKYLRENNFERYVYTIRELKMNDIGPKLPVPSYKQGKNMDELTLRFRNANLYPPNPFYQDGKPERK
ncbi:hypothetical protein WA556_006658, partial [Blastocystis sp. ATCC 50177/Nand II]